MAIFEGESRPRVNVRCCKPDLGLCVRCEKRQSVAMSMFAAIRRTVDGAWLRQIVCSGVVAGAVLLGGCQRGASAPSPSSERGPGAPGAAAAAVDPTAPTVNGMGLPTYDNKAKLATYPSPIARDFDRICNALAYSGADREGPENEGFLIAQYLGQALESAEARQFLPEFAQAQPADKAALLRNKAKALGVVTCPTAERWVVQ